MRHVCMYTYECSKERTPYSIYIYLHLYIRRIYIYNMLNIIYIILFSIRYISLYIYT